MIWGPLVAGIVLFAAFGVQSLIGGAGQDTLDGGPGNNILIQD